MVLDASVAACWFLSDERQMAALPLFERVSAQGASVPALFRWEMQSALLRAERNGLMTANDVDDALAVLRALPIEVEAPGNRFSVGGELPLARHYHLTAYDAAYLALAADRHLPLATFDAALLRAAADLDVETLPS
jgi:predicted nucleic acid-binding protein